jgi:hypothetical protein
MSGAMSNISIGGMGGIGGMSNTNGSTGGRTFGAGRARGAGETGGTCAAASNGIAALTIINRMSVCFIALS